MNKAINQQSFATLTGTLTSNVLTKRKSTSRKLSEAMPKKTEFTMKIIVIQLILLIKPAV